MYFLTRACMLLVRSTSNRSVSGCNACFVTRRLKDKLGRPLPSCIMMEKGESLDRWMQRNNRAMDQFTCMQVCTHARAACMRTRLHNLCIHSCCTIQSSHALSAVHCMLVYFYRLLA
jgi:hypothetical protein